ncbi:MAG: hypothetical protein JO017_07470 [Actinobacteria bacterium]|nr:hypothetical protein [Actinomycetota bacterium]
MRPLPRMIVPALIAALTAAASSTSLAAASQTLTVYSVAEQQQYINNSDARRAGAGPNPFGNYNDVAPAAKNAKGPFPGDEALYSFNLYADAQLHKRAGAATYTCQYNFKGNAFCDVTFQLTKRGVLVASGAFNFNATSFTLAVTGGYGSFANRLGSVQVTPTANHAQRVSFQLT